jgi:hypothetical protein
MRTWNMERLNLKALYRWRPESDQTGNRQLVSFFHFKAPSQDPKDTT